MAKKINQLTELAAVPETTDEYAIWDDSASLTKRVSRKNTLGYTEYVALLTQTGTNAPTATVVKNDTGATVVWARTLQGIYTATFSSAVLTENKTVVLIAHGANGTSAAGKLSGISNSTTVVIVYSYNTSFAVTDNALNSTPIIIRIYV